MARARNIKPGFFTNELLAKMSYQTQLFFIGLWTLADREGRLEDRPLRIKAALFPYSRADVDVMLNQLQTDAFLKRYEIKGQKFIQIINFLKHQRPHFKETKSIIPGPIPTKVSTGLGQAPTFASASRSDSLIPDSLIPDSLSTANPDRDFSEEVIAIAKIHPKIAHRKKGPSRIEEEVIAAAIAQDGRDLVLAGTRNLADAVAFWPASELKFIPDPVKFYQREDYKLDPATWDKAPATKMSGREGLGLGKAPDQIDQAEAAKIQAEIKAQNERMKARAANR